MLLSLSELPSRRIGRVECVRSNPILGRSYRLLSFHNRLEYSADLDSTLTSTKFLSQFLIELGYALKVNPAFDHVTYTIRFLNFAICYGMSAGSLVRKVNEVKKEQGQPFIDEAKAQEYIDGFHKRYPGISEFFHREWEKLRKLRREDRMVTSPAGRIRRFAARANPALERQFKVSLPQLMEADILKTAAVRLDRVFRRRGMGARIVMLIHDAMWVEVPVKEERESHRLMDRIMSTAGRPFLELKTDFTDS